MGAVGFYLLACHKDWPCGDSCDYFSDPTNRDRIERDMLNGRFGGGDGSMVSE